MCPSKARPIILLSVALLFASVLSIMITLFPPSAQAELKVKLPNTRGVWMDVPEILTASCEHCTFFNCTLPDDCTVLDCAPCSEDAIWTWNVDPTIPGANYDFFGADTPNPLFVAHTKTSYDVSVVVHDGQESDSSNTMRIYAWDPVYECPLSNKFPFIVYESPAFPSDAECAFDEDGNGLADLIEQKIADCFVPTFAFDAGEECWSLGPDEPHVVYNIAVDAVKDDAVRLLIRYGMVWQYDGGFQSSDICGNPHDGDTQSLTVTAWLRKRPGKAKWFAELESIRGFTQDPRKFYVTYTPPPDCVKWEDRFWSSGTLCDWWMNRDGTHPIVYPTEGKHHFRPEPKQYTYSSTIDCTENAYGNKYPWRTPAPQHVPHFPSAPPAASGEQGGPPILIHEDRMVWANACTLLKDSSNLENTINLRNVDIADWTFVPCPLDPTHAMRDMCCSSPLGNYLPGPLGGPKITDGSFLAGDSDVAAGIWNIVSGGFNADIDGDGLPFWIDPCPVVNNDNPDSDGDGLCDPIDVCPHDPNNDLDNDGICGSPPTCDAGGPYDVECNGISTNVVLNGSSSRDPGGFPLTYSWSTDCPGNLSDSASGTPTLHMNTSPGCAAGCTASLTVINRDGASASCESQITITDTRNPTIDCPSSQNVQCNDTTAPSHTGYATATDTCDTSPAIDYLSSIAPGRCADEWSISRTWIATDHCRNSSTCQQRINVSDTIAPVITCPTDVTITCEETPVPSRTGVATAADTCDSSPTVSHSDQSIDPTPSCASDDVITRSWHALDNCMNISTCNQVITILDGTAPIISCNAPATITPPDAPITFTATATDNCDKAALVEVTGYECFRFTNKGKRIDTTASCLVTVDGGTISIVDSNGVDNNIAWTVRATDCSGNQSTKTCGVLVVNPAKSKL